MSSAVSQGSSGLLARSARVPRASGAVPIAVAVLTAGVFVLRLSQIHQGLLGDEVFTLEDIAGHSFRSVLTTVHSGAENSPPLFFLFAWLTAKLGDPTVWIRLPSVVLGTATVPLVFLLGRATVGRAAGLIGAAVMAASPFSIYYGVEARPYATMAFFVTLSTLALLKALDTDERRWWVLYTLAAAGAAYSHYTSIFVLSTQAAWTLWARRENLRAPLIANAAVVVLYLPWLPHVRGKQLAVIGALQPLNLSNVLIDLMRLIPGYPYAPLRSIPTVPGLIALGLCAGLGLAALLHRWRAGSHRPPLERPWRMLLIGLLAVATPVGLLLYSLAATDLWLARGLYASVPAAALLIGALLVATPRPLRLGALVVVFVTLVAGTVEAISPRYQRPPFRALAAYLDRVAGPRDPIIFYLSFIDPAISAQFHKPHPVLGESLAAYRSVPRAGRAYAILDDNIAHALRIGTPHPPGLRLIARRHIGGLDPTELYVFQAP